MVLTRRSSVVSENDSGVKRVIFSPRDIVHQARRITEDQADTEKVSYEYVSVDEFAAMVDVDRSLLLKKLAGSEFSEDIFTFRKSEVVRLLNDKGKKFFADRKIKTPDQFTDVEDLAFADQKSLFDAVGRCDLYDLAKLLCSLDDEALRQKLLACLAHDHLQGQLGHRWWWQTWLGRRPGDEAALQAWLTSARRDIWL
mgnify:CR=1 FL=1